MSNNPYLQVAMTYVRRPFSSLQSGLVSIGFLFLLAPLLISMDRFDKNPGLATPQWLFLFFPFLFFALHVKEQFADARAHLTPNFRRIHITVAAAMAFILIILLPAALTCLYGWYSVGFIALTTTMFGGVLWLMLMPSSWLGYAIAIVWLVALFSTSGQSFLQQLVTGQLELLAIAFFVVGVWMVITAGRHLMQLNEDMPAYRTRTQWNWSGNKAMPRQTWTGEGWFFPKLRNWLAERQIASASCHASRASASWWSRICRWQIGMVTGWSLGLWILCAVVYIHSSTWLGGAVAREESTNLIALVLLFVPMLATMNLTQGRSNMLERDLLMPVDRKSYIRQVGVAAALSQLQLWVGTSIAMVFWYWLVNADPQPRQLSRLALILVLTGALQTGCFGIQTWIARFGSLRWNSLGMLVYFLPAQMLLFALVFRSPQTIFNTIWELIWIAGSIALAGLLITFDAYRRWLKMDFD